MKRHVMSSIVNANNCINEIFPFFDPLNCKFCLDFRLIDNFPSIFPFHQANHKYKESKKAYLCKLNNIFANTLSDPNSVIIVSDTNIRNNIAISILYVHFHFNRVNKTIHHAVNVTLTETKLFAIRYRINQAI